ncbi:MAG: hypothetical protein HWD59_01925 [Coxiellaceae bacterium]|nr:MAG: hypothetical protein HWD59_01925 [Coxiellaceae bacterium]
MTMTEENKIALLQQLIKENDYSIKLIIFFSLATLLMIEEAAEQTIVMDNIAEYSLYFLHQSMLLIRTLSFKNLPVNG